MDKPLSLFSGKWPRAARYAVREGYIHAASRAFIEYEAFEQFSTGGRIATKRPYDSLLELVPKLQFQAAPNGRLLPSETTERAVLQWCSRYGLLGILPSMVQSFITAPRWQKAKRIFDAIAEVVPKDFAGVPRAKFARQLARTTHGLAAVTEVCIKTAGEWKAWPSEHIFTYGQAPEARNGELLPESQWFGSAKPGVFLWRPDISRWRYEGFDETWARFFPDISGHKIYRYPLPNTERFLRIYAEPIDEFAKWARRFHDSFATTLDGEDDGDFLAWLASAVAPVLLRDAEDRPAVIWRSPTLLSSFALMALLDLSAGLTPRRCENCRRIFPEARDNNYCSVRCRETAKKRRYRRRKKGDRVAHTPRGRGKKLRNKATELLVYQ